jgi:signal transduction histidine kinase
MDDSDKLLIGEGQMRALMRAYDWSDFPLGPPSRWPVPLKVVAQLTLDSCLPRYVAWGADLPLIYNDAYAELLGDRHPSAFGRPLREVWPEVIDQIRPTIEDALAGKSSFAVNMELQLMRQGRLEPGWFTFTAAPVRDERGEVAGIFTSAIETTAQIVAQRRTMAESAQLQKLFAQAPGFMAVLRGPEHVFELVNHAYLQMVGHRDMFGKPAREAVPEAAGQGFFELLDNVYASGEPFVGRGASIRLQREPGSEPVERIVDFVYQPIVEADGSVSGIFVEGSDVTEQRAAQNELARLNERLATKLQKLQAAERRQAFQLELADLLRNLNDPAEIFSRSSAALGRHLRVCRVLYGEYDIEHQRIFFHSSYTDGKVAEISGSYPTAQFGADNFASLESGITWICNDLASDPRTAGADTWPMFEKLHIQSGIVVPLHRDGTMLAALFINDAKPRQWTVDEVQLVEDAAERTWSAVERTRAEAALRQADRRKDEFLAMLAHELRNPLAPISAAAELMGLVSLDEKRLKQTSQVIARQVRHMTGLVDDLLDVSRVTRGLVSLDKRPQDMKGIVANALEQVQPFIEARRHHLRVQLAPDMVQVLGDAKRLVQILTNLMSNAAKYTPEGGNIDLLMEAEPHQVRLTVQDNGIGIAPDLQPHVFDLFAQAERTSDRAQGGLGLGLALVKSLVELHGGKVACSSEGAGTGSRFTVCLPRMAQNAVMAERRQSGRELPSTRQLRVLIVDDNHDAAQMLALFLEASGHAVAVEHNAHKALTRVQNEPPDACLLDIGLPEIDGNELARRLRGNPATARAKLIAITGYGQEHDRKNALAAGFDHHSVKPVDPGKLAALLADIPPA